MKKIALLFMLSTFAFALNAAARDQQQVCSNETLKGAYAEQITGTRPTGPGGPLEQVIGVVLVTFDGEGHFTQVDNVHGSITGTIPDRPGTGTYVVNSDCSGTLTLQNAGAPFPLVIQVVIFGKQEFRSVVVSPQAVMVSAEAKRIEVAHHDGRDGD